MKDFDICGLGGAFVDLFVDISEEDFKPLGFKKATMELVSVADQEPLLARLGEKEPQMASGGSVANSVIAATQLGAKTAMCCPVAEDRYGRFYTRECRELGVVMPCPVETEGSTGTAVVLVTPDAERTMRTCLGVSGAISARHVDPDAVARSTWLFVEGYLFANGTGGPEAVDYAITHAKAKGTKVAITCSEPWVISAFRDSVESAISRADLIFCNADEAKALANADDALTAGRQLAKRIPNVVVTAGPDGAYIWWGGEESHAKAFPCQPRDLTGAGDMFAGSFLYGITYGYSPSESAARACYLAKLVISQVGARLRCDVKAEWNRAFD